MIVLKNITKKYKSNIIIESFSYTFNDTGLYGITGKSGVGKTTLLNIISNIIKPTSGEVYYTSSINQISQKMSYIYQNFNLFDNLTIIENINLVLKIHNIIKTSMEIDEILTIVGIDQLKEAKAFELSGGERQRLSISLALLCDSKVIIADEPVSNLDEKNSFEIMNLLKKISKTKLVIMSTHNRKDLINYCDKIINLEDDKFTPIKELTDINPQIKQKKCKTSFMTCLYIRKKIIKTQKS